MEVHFAPPIFQSTPPVKAATPAACSPLQAYRFHSTPPVKAATLYLIVRLYQIRISIHAAREGGDVLLDDGVLCGTYFNPRRP